MKLIYACFHDPCCADKNSYKSHEQLLKDRAEIVTLYLCPNDFPIEEACGDDWNDAPACCNSGTPYKDEVPGLKIVTLRLGDKVKIV